MEHNKKYFPSTTLPTNDRWDITSFGFIWLFCVESMVQPDWEKFHSISGGISEDKLLFQVRSSCASNLIFEFAHTVSRQKSCTTQNNSISPLSSWEWLPYIYGNIHIFYIHLWHEYEIWISCPAPCTKKWKKWGFESFTNTSCESLQKYEELSTR